jgi:hypothetical protein
VSGAAPAPVAANGKSYPWQALDPAKADMGALWGLRGPQGSTFLLRPSPYPDWDFSIVAVGLWSGLANTDGKGMESIASEIDSLATCHPGMTGMDRRIKPSEFKAWITEGEG